MYLFLVQQYHQGFFEMLAPYAQLRVKSVKRNIAISNIKMVKFRFVNAEP